MTLKDKINNLLMLAAIDGERREILKKGILEIIKESMPESASVKDYEDDEELADGWDDYRIEMLKILEQ